MKTQENVIITYQNYVIIRMASGEYLTRRAGPYRGGRIFKTADDCIAWIESKLRKWGT